MGEDCGSRFPRKQFDWQSHNLNHLSSSNCFERQNSIPVITNPGTNMVSTNGTLPVNAYPMQPHLQVVQANEPHGWFYCLPCFRQAFTPASNSLLSKQLPVGPFENGGETIKPQAGSGCPQKKFLVFDQSGDQTTLIFSPGIGTPAQCLPSWSSKLLGRYNLKQESPRAKGDTNFHSGPNFIDELDETNETNLQSEMQEDTEELNALLYSDDSSDYTDDDEVTSTGHSPSTMTVHNKPDWFDGSAEEVASSAGPSKKRKHFYGDCDCDDVPLLIVSASSVKYNPHLDNEDDAESSCGNSQNPGSYELSYQSSFKRMRKEKMRKTVSVLRSIIPNGAGKDAMLVLDEAIDYLKSLKLKAKSFGLDTL